MAIPAHTRTFEDEAYAAAEAALTAAGISFTVVARCACGHCPVCGPAREPAGLSRPHTGRPGPERTRPLRVVTPARVRRDR